MQGINSNNIKESALRQSPWNHLVVDDFLTTDAYQKITKEFVNFCQKNNIAELEFNDNGWWPFELLEKGFAVEVMELILQINNQFLEHYNILKSKLKFSDSSKIGYFSIPRLSCQGPNQRNEIHDDGDEEDKTVIAVIYLDPIESLGTNLYSTCSQNNLVDTIEWRPNRAFIFHPIKNKTWHSFNSGDLPRLTINFYFERMEDSSYINTLNDDKIKWFWENFTNEKIVYMIDNKKEEKQLWQL